MTSDVEVLKGSPISFSTFRRVPYVVPCKYTGSLVRVFLGPNKMRTIQKTHQLNQHKTRGDMGPPFATIK